MLPDLRGRFPGLADGHLHNEGGGPGLDYVFARFKPRLERELGAELSEQIFVANPAQAFACPTV